MHPHAQRLLQVTAATAARDMLVPVPSQSVDHRSVSLILSMYMSVGVCVCLSSL